MNAALRRQTLADLLRRTAKRFPSKTAIIWGDTRWSYAEFDAVCEALAAGLAARGVGKGVRVAILSRNSHAFAALRFALARLGAVLVPINFMLKPEEAAFILKHAGAEMLATDSGLAEVARAAAALDTKVRELIWLPSEEATEPAPGMIAFDELLSNAAPPEVDLSGSDIAQIVYTSGTESLPKGAMLTHDAVIWQYVSCVADASIATDDLALHALPLLPLRPARCVPGSGHLCRLDQRHHRETDAGQSPAADRAPPCHLVLRAADGVDFALALAAV